MEDISRFADRIIVMDKGTIALSGKPREVFKEIDFLESIGLAAPQVTYLMKGLKRKDPEVRDDIYTIEEAKKKY